MKKIYLIYDERYWHDPSSATILCCAETIEDARDDIDLFSMGVIVECDDDNGVLKNPIIVS